MHQKLDERITAHIQTLVAEGVYDTEEMKRHLKIFVKKYPFEIESCTRPSLTDRRFYPSSKDIKNGIYRAKVKLRFSKIDQENFQSMVNDWAKSAPEDQFYFRPYKKDDDDDDERNDKKDDNATLEEQMCIKKNASKPSNRLLFVHQTREQKRLLQLYGNNLFLLDATYRVTRYSLPLFFVVVRTNVDYQVVGSFIIQDETTDATTEALAILQQWNCQWAPKFAMTDMCAEEISAIESVFPG